MNKKELVNVIVGTVVGLVVIPGLARATYNNIIVPTANGIGKLVYKAKIKKGIKKGIKEGRIIECDGNFYEVEDVEYAEAMQE